MAPINPEDLAKSEASRIHTEGISARAKRQTTEDDADYPAYWQGYDANRGLHTIQRLGQNTTTNATSISSGGLQPGQAVDTAYSANYTTIDTTPYKRQTTTRSREVTEVVYKAAILYCRFTTYTIQFWLGGDRTPVMITEIPRFTERTISGSWSKSSGTMVFVPGNQLSTVYQHEYIHWLYSPQAFYLTEFSATASYNATGSQSPYVASLSPLIGASGVALIGQNDISGVFYFMFNLASTPGYPYDSSGNGTLNQTRSESRTGIIDANSVSFGDFFDKKAIFSTFGYKPEPFTLNDQLIFKNSNARNIFDGLNVYSPNVVGTPIDSSGTPHPSAQGSGTVSGSFTATVQEMTKTRAYVSVDSDGNAYVGIAYHAVSPSNNEWVYERYGVSSPSTYVENQTYNQAVDVSSGSFAQLEMYKVSPKNVIQPLTSPSPKDWRNVLATTEPNYTPLSNDKLQGVIDEGWDANRIEGNKVIRSYNYDPTRPDIFWNEAIKTQNLKLETELINITSGYNGAGQPDPQGNVIQKIIMDVKSLNVTDPLEEILVYSVAPYQITTTQTIR